MLPIASAIAAITKRIRIGTYLVLLPLHNAVRVAEDAATIDIISNGRFDLGVGQGYAPGEFAAYGVNRKTRASRLEEMCIRDSISTAFVARGVSIRSTKQKLSFLETTIITTSPLIYE